MIVKPETGETDAGEDFFIFPLAFPVLCGIFFPQGENALFKNTNNKGVHHAESLCLECLSALQKDC